MKCQELSMWLEQWIQLYFNLILVNKEQALLLRPLRSTVVKTR